MMCSKQTAEKKEYWDLGHKKWHTGMWRKMSFVISTFTRYYYDDQIKKDEMDETTWVI
jgi:hypothetical protein